MLTNLYYSSSTVVLFNHNIKLVLVNITAAAPLTVFDREQFHPLPAACTTLEQQHSRGLDHKQFQQQLPAARTTQEQQHNRVLDRGQFQQLRAAHTTHDQQHQWRSSIANSMSVCV